MHILDNPAWHALNSGNQLLAHGDRTVRFFWNDVSPFVGLKENTASLLEHMHSLLPFDGPFALVSPTSIALPPCWNILQAVPVWQMVSGSEPRPLSVAARVTPLTEADVPQMLELTRLTNPGPFEQRTIQFGHYEGIYENNRLVAMAGQRMHPKPYAEISAVCTHPDYLGRGLATQLLARQILRIKTAGEIPFLHVKSDNLKAIKVYTGLGFEKRKELIVYIIERTSAVG
ncbi:GNAT family N-acetyltransferase [Parapedobacter deserti]|uniref:GNAT family N-acetyltransferase n=1 Tax=Parapedobacter deserti TaxID=1912957 RepID=A0ABV7JNV2_9SPHI